MVEKYWLDEFPRVKVAGFDYKRVPRKAFKERLARMRSMAGTAEDETDEEQEEGEVEEGEVLVPYYPPDPKLAFPGTPLFEDAGPLVRSGIAQHVVLERGTGTFVQGEWPGGFCASQLNIFEECSWYGECFQVLEAHGWTDHGEVTIDVIQKVANEEGDGVVEDAKKRYGTEWKCYILEIAAKHFTEPLSRLWYAANMMSLYYIHYDDLRFGYLWSEYRMKMRYELFALKHIEMTEKNRESGQKGGQADKKRERYEVLDRLARQRFKELAFASDRACVRLARSWASDHDMNVEVPLFAVGGKPLSQKWYEDWVAHFRHAARGVE